MPNAAYWKLGPVLLDPLIFQGTPEIQDIFGMG
jgi:hypothetical protein